MKFMPTGAVAGLFLAALLAAGWANADETKIRQILQARMPAMKVESVTRSPFPGLYEVVLDGEIVYTDEKAEYFFGGNIYDIRTLPPRNVTQERTQQLVAQTFTNARGLAIKRVRGGGARTLFTFEDPNCVYCKALTRELAKLDDVTIYTFLLPLLSQNSVEKSLAVWCAKDRAGAWEALMSKGAVPDDGTTCANPLERIAALARRYQIQSTPAIFLGDGRHIGGMRSALDIEKALGSVKPRDE
ncbi:MAG: DsbC family protein [Betaproteobacteria bacterium]|nr:DsbC family protein [Betaproteobacteria bacterium]